MTLVESNPAHAGACGQCGYAVRGLTTFVCPECGADLRQVGIVRPDAAGRRRRRAVAALVAWTLLTVGGAVAVSPVIRARYWPVEVAARQLVILRRESRGYEIRYTVVDRWSRWGHSAPPSSKGRRTIEVTFAPGQAPARSFVVSEDADAPARFSYRKLSPPGTMPSEGAFTPRFMGEVLGASASGAEPEVAYELIAGHAPAGAEDPWGTVMMQVKSRGLGYAFSGASPTVGPVVTVTERWPFVPVAVVAWAAVWALGAWWLARRARRFRASM